MIVSIMQPYLLPYIGYFQLIAASDLFVVYDDVQYMKGGWINRNRILLGGAAHWLTLPVERDEVATNIDARRYQLSAEVAARHRGLLDAAYRKAPHAAEVLPLAEAVLGFDDPNVARFNAHGLEVVCQALGIGAKIVASSGMERDRSLRGQEAVLDIARRLGATRYLNAIGGVELYDPAAFADAGLELAFIRPRPEPYPQFGAEHVPNLSILDVLMFCDAERRQAQLGAYDILVPQAEAAP